MPPPAHPGPLGTRTEVQVSSSLPQNHRTCQLTTDADTGPMWAKKNHRTCQLTTKELEEKLSHVLSDEEEEESSQSESTVGKKKNTISRSSSKRVAPILGKFNDTKKTLLRQIGFENSMHIPGINKIDRAYTVELMMRIDCDARELHIDANTKIKLSDMDVKRVFSIPCGKRKVCGLGTDEPEDTLDFIRLCIGAGAVDAYNNLEAAENNITKEYSGVMTQEEADQFKVSYVVWIMNRFYVPSCRPNSGSKTFWGSLMDADEIAGYNWCGYILDGTIEAARKAQYDMAAKKVVANVGGCPLFLQVLALDTRLLPFVADYDCNLLGKLIQAHKKIMADNFHKSTQDGWLGEFLEEVNRAKMDINLKVSMKCHMAKLLKLNSQQRSDLIRNAIALVRNLSGC